MKSYDLTLGTNGAVKKMDGGFFERVQRLSLSDAPEQYDSFKIGDSLFRIVRPSHPEIASNMKGYNQILDYLKKVSIMTGDPVEKVEG